MASILPGYEYDIFISYRQKDNKYDGWVTEFVDNLKRELEATFKEDISVYFDINAHDGLLETHDVDATLRNKLKCLICIPVISRTYCDPKSFAWEHEFKPFVEQASHDEFGMKIRLPNGNIANRILPVRIHELNSSDIKLFESVAGTNLRPIDFIYKETGVNRQLRAKDDDIIKHSNQGLYRNQINKVALALKDIIEIMQVETAENQPDGISIGDEHQNKANSDNTTKIESKKETHYRFSGRKLAIASIILLASTASGSIILIHFHNSQVRWAKELALSEIKELALKENYSEAFRLALKTEKYISKEPEFKEISNYISKLSIHSDPSGADVYIRKYSDINGIWTKIGTTPIDSLKLPPRTYYLVRIEKKGYERVLAPFLSSQSNLSRKLFSEGTIPEGMVYVEGLYSNFEKISLPDQNYYIDRYEVTNKQYKEFVESGGYSNHKFWKNEFVKEGKVISWSEAMKDFIDKTGRPGPSTWEAGDYPENQDNFPVSGISWYEAAAFAEYVGKSLPTLDHWSNAAWSNSYYFHNFSSKIAPLSNFNGKGPEPVGKNQGISYFGTYDMAGNVREWCWNETFHGRVICGGAWDNVNYMYSQWSQLSPFDRSSRNGFRCVKYTDQQKIPEIAFRKVKFNYDRDFTKEKPVSDDVFRIYKNQFQYDKADLAPRIEKRDTSFKDWIVEKISYNAAYGNERIKAYLFLPKNGFPPFQTMLYFPGSDAVEEKDLVRYQNTISHVDFILKNGRAVLYPVYIGTFERREGLDPILTEGNQTHEYTDWLIKWVKDFKRSVDYLQTRSDIDTNKLGYYGASWGGMLGGIIPAVEDRLKLSILYAGGFDLALGGAFPEADPFNYVSKIKIPVLMLNGKFDSFFPYETTVLPFFNLLGTPAADKKSLVYNTDHAIPPIERMKETLNWLDKYFGPAKLKSNFRKN